MHANLGIIHCQSNNERFWSDAIAVDTVRTFQCIQQNSVVLLTEPKNAQLFQFTCKTFHNTLNTIQSPTHLTYMHAIQ